MKSILVTGGAGFLGAHLVERLIKNFHVVIVDIQKNIGGISYLNPKADYLNYNICDNELYKKLDKYKFEAIFHLAAQSAGEPSYDDINFDINTNAYGTCLLAKYCSEKGIKRFIYTSTVAVYGSSRGQAFKESDPIEPDSVYGITKYSGELFIQQFFKKNKQKFTIFRVFNTFGPGENLNFRKKGMLSIYASYLWRNEPILVKGSLDRYRDFLFIDDNIDILYDSLYNESSYNNIYNLSSGNKIIIRDLIKKMIKVSGNAVNYEIIESSNTPGDSFGTNGSIEKLKTDFNWAPKVSLIQGLQKYFEWINKLPIIDNLSGYHPLEMRKK